MKAIWIALLLPLLAWAEPATVIRATALKKDPATDAATVSELQENAAVDVLERRGGWSRVKAAGAEGWVKLLALRYGTPGRQGESGLSQIFNVARTGASGTQATTGVRGLDAESIADAQPDNAELQKMQSYAATSDAAAAFASEAKLKAVAVEEPQ